MNAPEFINSATVRVTESLVLKAGSGRKITLGVRYGLWIHPALGPVLIDTGYGPEVMSCKGRSLPLQIYAAAVGPKLITGNDAVVRLAELGFAPRDVNHILITHFHADHISRLKAFTAARFHVSGAAYQRLRAMGELKRLRHGHFFELLPADFVTRMRPFEANQTLDLPYGLGQGFDVLGDGTVCGFDLPGHALGHTGLFWPEANGPLIYGGDAQWLTEAILQDRPPQGPARLVYEDEEAMRASLSKLRQAVARGCTLQLCHDPVEA